jgi:hypothetical protein
MSISARVRFAVLQRDGFRCRYCGRPSPNAVLHVDHIEPRADGGADDPANLCAACEDCNRGKADRPLDGLTRAEEMQSDGHFFVTEAIRDVWIATFGRSESWVAVFDHAAVRQWVFRGLLYSEAVRATKRAWDRYTGQPGVPDQAEVWADFSGLCTQILDRNVEEVGE